jgi:hypothetical protein
MASAKVAEPVPASLALIAGGNKAAVGAELKKTGKGKAAATLAVVAEPEETVVTGPEVAAAVEVDVEIDDMSDDQLNALVTEHGVEVPGEWASWDESAKRDFLKSQYDLVSEGAAEEKVPFTPDPVNEQAVAVIEQPAKVKKAKGKAVAKKSLDGEIIPADQLTDLIHEIETLDEKHAIGCVAELIDQAEVTYFRLGGVFSLIICNGWHKPYTTFREFVEVGHGIGFRKANYFVSIYNYLAESKVPWSKFDGLGWSKVKEIAGVVNNDNVDQWVKLAHEQNALTLIETVKNYKKSLAGKSIEDQSAKTVTTMTFKVHEGQKEVIEAAVAKAKEQGGTEVATVALENICGDYLAGTTMSAQLKAMSVKSRAKAIMKAGDHIKTIAAVNLEMGLEDALAALELAYPNAKIEVDLQDAKVEAA